MDRSPFAPRTIARLLAVSTLCVGGMASAECTLSGVVKADSLLLPGAKIVLKHKNVEIGRASTGNDGAYEIVFPAFPSGVRAVSASVTKKHFIADERNLIGTGNARCPRANTNSVELVREGGVRVVNFSVTGQTIYIAPYEIWGEGGKEIKERINKHLPKFVKSGIGAYTSMLGPSTADIDFSVDHLGEDLGYEQGEKLRLAGEARNALGVIAGDGQVKGLGEDRKISLESIFRTIPRTEAVALSVQPFYDEITAREARPSSIGRELKHRWGKQAMLSYVLNGIAQHEGAWALSEINRLKDLLVKVRSTMTEGDELKPALDALMNELVALEGGAS